MLKLSLKLQDGAMLTGLNGSGWGPVADSSGHGCKLSGSIRQKNF